MPAAEIDRASNDPRGPTVRRYRAQDRAAVRAIACETGFHGGPIDRFYRDRESFADWATAWFTDCEAERAFVACLDRRVVGYLLLTRDARLAEAAARASARRHLLRRHLWARPGTAGFYRNLLLDLLRDRGLRRPAVDFERYPGQIHMNLLREVRDAGVGVMLLRMAYASAVESGIAGVHGFVNAENHAIAAAVRRVGGEKRGEPYPVPGLRTAEGRRVFAQMLALELPR